MIRQQRLRQEVQVCPGAVSFGGGMSQSAFFTICFLVTSSLSHIFYHSWRWWSVPNRRYVVLYPTHPEIPHNAASTELKPDTWDHLWWSSKNLTRTCIVLLATSISCFASPMKLGSMIQKGWNCIEFVLMWPHDSRNLFYCWPAQGIPTLRGKTGPRSSRSCGRKTFFFGSA